MRHLQTLRHIALCGLVCLAAAAHSVSAAPSDPATLQQQIAAAASSTQARCHGLIHHDTYEFEDCVLGLLRGEPKVTPARLGIEYFGFVGALNSARMGMQGADDAMATFLPRFRLSQKRLKLSDTELCLAIPGDCTTRVARIKLIESAPRPRHAPVRERDLEHQHVH